MRIYYHKIKKILKPPEKEKRKLIAVDENKLKLAYSSRLLPAEVLSTLMFTLKALKYCENKLEVVVDIAFWHK